MITYKKLTRDEIEKLHDFDRTELVLKIYYMRNKELELVDERYDIGDWSVEHKSKRIGQLQTLFDAGATFFGAFDSEKLIGMAVLDHTPVTTGHARLNLKGLWVSDGFRGQGVGGTLFHLVTAAAQLRSATVIYISATPTEKTVHFYQNLGCIPANPIDPTLFEKEPKDIHFEFLIE